MLGLLSAEFLLGMLSNLYVEFPTTTDQQTLMDATWKHWQTASHAILGILIVLIGLWLVILSIKAKVRSVTVISVLAFLSLVLAAVGGDRFVRTQHNVWSLTMAVGFIVAMGLYGRLLALVQSATNGS